MTSDELTLLTQMRHYQRKFEAERNSLYQKKAKEFEKELDALLAKYNPTSKTSNNSQSVMDFCG